MMSKTTLPLTALLFLLGSTFAFSDKADAKMMEKNYTEVTILDEGVKRIIHIPKDVQSHKQKPRTLRSTKQQSKEGVMVSFAKTRCTFYRCI